MILAHMDAIRRAGFGTQRAEHALLIVDGVTQQLAPRRGPRLLVDLARLGFVDVDAIDRAGFGTHVTRDALVCLELVNPTVSRGECQLFVGVADRHRPGEQILERDPHTNGDGLDRIKDIAEIGFC